MKCQKCGYTSFDFLAECKKCGTDLVTIRDALGFDAVKPSMPFFLGALLKDYTSSAPRKKDSRDQYAEIEFGEFEMDAQDKQEGVAPTLGFPGGASDGAGRSSLSPGRDVRNDEITLAAPASPVVAEAASVSAPPVSEKNDSLGELDFDVDFLLEPEPPKSSTAPPVSRSPISSSPSAALPDNDQDLAAIDISDDELRLLIEEIDSVPKAPATPRATRAPSQPAESPATTSEDNLIIELSDKDLENLLLELEETPEPGDRKKPS